MCGGGGGQVEFIVISEGGIIVFTSCNRGGHPKF